MSVLFILTIVFAGLFLVSLIAAWVFDEAWIALVGLIFVMAALFLWGAGNAENKAKYDQETINICESHGGVVTKDNHCFKDNKPIEFEPGIWQRN